MKLEELELSLLFDYYGELLTEKQRTCFELYYNQDFSLGEIAGEAGISRQAVYDTLARAESALRTMEGRVGAVAGIWPAGRRWPAFVRRQRPWPRVRIQSRPVWLGKFWRLPPP